MNFLRCASLGIVWSAWDYINSWIYAYVPSPTNETAQALLDTAEVVDMTVHQVNEKDVAVWLHQNQEWFEDFVLAHAKRDLIQRWLDRHSETNKSQALSNSILSPTQRKDKHQSVFFGGIVSTAPPSNPVVSSPSPVLSTPSSSSYSTVSSSSRKTEHSDSGEKSESTSSDEGIAPPRGRDLGLGNTFGKISLERDPKLSSVHGRELRISARKRLINWTLGRCPRAIYPIRPVSTEDVGYEGLRRCRHLSFMSLPSVNF